MRIACRPTTVASIHRAWSSASSPGRPLETSSSGYFDRMATPLKDFCPCVSTLYPLSSKCSRGKLASIDLISWSTTTSGAAASSQAESASIRALIPLMLKLATFTGPLRNSDRQRTWRGCFAHLWHGVSLSTTLPVEAHRARVGPAEQDAHAFVRRRAVSAGEKRGEGRGTAGFGDDAEPVPEERLCLADRGVGDEDRVVDERARDLEHQIARPPRAEAVGGDARDLDVDGMPGGESGVEAGGGF